jgi:hypothetical protein
MTDLPSLLAPISVAVAELNLDDPERAVRELNHAFPVQTMEALTAALLAAHAAGTLTPREGGAGIRFGRAAKPGQLPGGCSVDVVDIEGAGAAHTHPRGEVSWCVPLSGAPTFEGVRSGWAVLAPGSSHIPTVTGGRMLIAYWLPDGALTWS